MPTVLLLGLKLYSGSLSRCAREALRIIRRNRRTGRSDYLATVNLDYLSRLNNAQNSGHSLDQRKFDTCVRQAVLRTADGMPVLWLSRLRGQPIPERVTGADLTPAICKQLAKQRSSFYILGADADTAARAVAALRKEAPGLEYCGGNHEPIQIVDGRCNKAQVQQIADQINISNPDLLLLALGSPKQEVVYQDLKPYINVPLTMGVGATIDFLGGSVRRAPFWMRSTGLEWLHRLYSEPRRLAGRYARNAAFLCKVIISGTG